MSILKYLSYKKIILLSLFFHMMIPFFSKGFHHPDEFYYGINYSFLKLGLFDAYEPSWEYIYKIRPWLLPTLFSGLISLFKVFTLDTFALITLLQVTSSLFGFLAHFFFYQTVQKKFNLSESALKVFCFFNFLMWPILYMNARTSSENWSTSFLLFGMCLFFSKKTWKLILAGLLFGIAYSLRFQIGLVAFCMGVNYLAFRKFQFLDFVKLSSGILLGIGFGILSDYWGYGEWTFTLYNYFEQNILLGKMSNFGVSPWWYYFKKIILNLSPFIGIPILISLVARIKEYKSDAITWSVVIFVIFHSALGHKEFRFIYSVLPLALVPFSIWVAKLKKKVWLNLAVVANLLVIVPFNFKAAYTPYKFYEALWNKKEVSKLYVYPSSSGGHANFELGLLLRKDLEIINYKKGENIDPVSYIFTTKYDQLQSIKGSELGHCELVYSTYPAWIFEFNYFNWLKRSNIWALSRCVK